MADRLHLRHAATAISDVMSEDPRISVRVDLEASESSRRRSVGADRMILDVVGRFLGPHAADEGNRSAGTGFRRRPRYQGKCVLGDVNAASSTLVVTRQDTPAVTAKGPHASFIGCRRKPNVMCRPFDCAMR
jgi:hypothetical protein